MKLKSCFYIVIMVLFLSLPIMVNSTPIEVSLNKVTVVDGLSYNRGVILEFSDHIDKKILKNSIKLTPMIGRFRIIKLSQKNKFKLLGNFISDKNYKLEILEYLLNKNGKTLKKLKGATYNFKGPGLPLHLNPPVNRRIIELKGRQILPLSISEISTLRCKLERIPPLVASIPASKFISDTYSILLHKNMEQNLRSIRELSSNNSFKSFRSFYNPENKKIKSEETFFIQKSKKLEKFSLPLTFRNDKNNGGIYLTLLQGESNPKKIVKRVILQITDLGILYKFSKESCLLWVTSLHDAKPLSNAEILFVRKDNSRIYGGKTDKDGLLIVKNGKTCETLLATNGGFKLTSSKLKVGELVGAIVSKNNDYSYISFSSNRLAYPDINIVKDNSKKIKNPRNIKIFTERGIYKPGETVYFKGCVREFQNGKIKVPDLKTIKIIMKDPLGRKLYTHNFKLSQFGTIDGNFKIKKIYRMGKYNIYMSLLDSKNKELKTSIATFSVQEFERPRHFVNISFSERSIKDRDYAGIDKDESLLDIKIKPEYYTGGFLKHCKVRWKANLIGDRYNVDNYSNYIFGNNSNEKILLESGEALTDSNGELVVSIPVNKNDFNGLSAIEVSATAVDIDGKSATGKASYIPKPEYKLGIANGYPDYFKIGTKYIFKAILLDKNDKIVKNGNINIKILKKDWFYTLKRNSEGEVTYSWDENWIEAESRVVPVKNGKIEIPVNMASGGKYILKISYKNGEFSTTSQCKYDVDWSYYDYYTDVEANKNREVLSASKMVLSTSKKAYKSGELIKVEFNTRRNINFCLVTVEREKILEAKVLKIFGNSGEFTQIALKKFSPDIYISMVGISPRGKYPIYGHDIDSESPFAFIGSKKIEVLKDYTKLDISMKFDRDDGKYRPGDTLSIELSCNDNNKNGIKSDLFLCVVDESLLALTNFKTPSYNSLRDFTLPLSIISGESRFNLISQDSFKLIHNNPLTGGGGGGSGTMLETIALRKNFNPVAYINGEIITSSDGKAKVEFKLPDTTTKYRVYAIACDDKALFGTTEKSILVTKDFYLTPSLPSFFVSGDKFNLSLNIFNKSNKSGEVTILASSDGKISFDKNGENFLLTPDSKIVKRFNCKVGKKIGVEKLSFRGKFLDFTDGIEVKREILSKNSRNHKFITGSFKKFDNIKFPFLNFLKKISKDQLMGEKPVAKLLITQSLWSKIEPALKYLMHYPYGCIEQTSSSLIPLIAIKKLMKKGYIKNLNNQKIDEFIKAGIMRIMKMHVTYSGFSYWPGGKKADYNGSIYAVYALLLAKKNGYEIDDTILQQSLSYLKSESFSRKKSLEINHDYYSPYSFSSMAPYELAMAGKIKPGDIKILFGDYKNIKFKDKSLFLLTNFELECVANMKLKSYLKKLDIFKNLQKMNRWERYRTAALYLMAELTINRKITPLSNKIAGYLMSKMGKNGSWNSTMDSGFILLSLATYLEKTKYKEKDEIKISVDGKSYLLKKDENLLLSLDFEKLVKDEKLKLKSKGNSLINYSLELSYPELSETTESGDIEIEKSIENMNGNNEFHLGDVVKVTLKLKIPAMNKRSGWYSDYEYMVLNDPLPAGFQAINPAISSEEKFTSVDDEKNYSYDNGFYNIYPDYKEFRKEKVMIFKDSIWAGWFKYEYYARVICSGSFYMKPTQVEFMYNRDHFGITKGKVINVEN